MKTTLREARALPICWKSHAEPHGFARSNLIVRTVTDHRKGVRLLDDYERVRWTRYYDVVLANAADPRPLLERLQARKAADPEACPAISSVVPVGSAFELRSDAERETNEREERDLERAGMPGRSAVDRADAIVTVEVGGPSAWVCCGTSAEPESRPKRKNASPPCARPAKR